MGVSRQQPWGHATSTRDRRKRSILTGMTGRFGTRLAWIGCGLALLSGLVGLLVAAQNRGVTPVPELLLIAGAISYSCVGTLIAIRRPANRIGWLLLLTGVLASVCLAVSGYALVALVLAPGSLPLGIWAIWIFTWLIWLVLTAMALVLLVFPDGRLPSRRWWIVGAVLVVSGGSLAVLTMLGPGAIVVAPSAVSFGPNPAGVGILA